MVHDVWRDMRFALRLLAKDRAFTLITVTVLGLGIGVANMQFVLLNGFALRGLPIPDVDRVLFVGARDAQDNDVPVSYRELEVIQSGTRSLDGLAGFANASVVIGDEGRTPDRSAGTYLSAAGFRVLAERPAIGRDFEAADDRAGAPLVVILGDRLWKSRYDSDRSIVGRSVRINGTPATVIGVMAPGFRFPSNTDVWLPLSAMPGLLGDARATRSLSAIGRLTTAASIAGLRGELNAVGAQLSHDFPESNRGTRITAVPINEQYGADLSNPAWLAFIGVGVIVILIACANAANLLLMRSIRRRAEMAVRASLGASRRRLVQQLFAESAVLAALGGVAGTAASFFGVRMITQIIPEGTLAYFTSFTMDGRVFAVLCALCLGTVFLFGLAPALHVSRVDVSHLMKDGGRGGTTGVEGRRWTTAILTAEFGLTMVLLTTLALSVRIARGTERATTVVDPDGVTTASISLPANRNPSNEQRLALYREFEARLGRVPGVSAVAVTTALPLSGGVPRRLAVEGLTIPDEKEAPTAWTVAASERYFDAMGLQLLGGRTFTERDGRVGNETAIVNERVATAFFPQGDAIGRRIRLVDPSSTAAEKPAWLTIVGISPTVRQRTVAEPDFVVYLPLASAPPASAVVVVRARSDAGSTASLLRETMRALDPELPLYRMRTMERALLDAQWNARLSTTLLSSIALVNLLLAAAGLYAVFAHAVVQRTQELGIRMALGARGPHIVGTVARRAAVHLVLGLAAGVAFTWAFERLAGVRSDAFGYHMSDLTTLIAAASLMAMVTAVASAVPAYRASRLDPVQALRAE